MYVTQKNNLKHISKLEFEETYFPTNLTEVLKIFYGCIDVRSIWLKSQICDYKYHSNSKLFTQIRDHKEGCRKGVLIEFTCDQNALAHKYLLCELFNLVDEIQIHSCGKLDVD